MKPGFLKQRRRTGNFVWCTTYNSSIHYFTTSAVFRDLWAAGLSLCLWGGERHQARTAFSYARISRLSTREQCVRANESKVRFVELQCSRVDAHFSTRCGTIIAVELTPVTTRTPIALYQK